MNFSFLKEFDDLPRGGVKSQKDYLRTGTELNLQTALALYRNRELLRNYYFLTFFPAYSYLYGNDFLQNMWKDVKYNYCSPTQGKSALSEGLSDATFLFGEYGRKASLTLIAANQFVPISRALLEEAKKWPYKDRKVLCSMIKPDVAYYISETFGDFANSLSIEFCENQITKAREEFLTATWQNLDDKVGLMQRVHINYALLPFKISNHKNKVDEVAQDFIKNREWQKPGLYLMLAWKFISEFMSRDVFVAFLKSLDISKPSDEELLKILIQNRNRIDDRTGLLKLDIEDKIDRNQFSSTFLQELREWDVLIPKLDAFIYRAFSGAGMEG